MGYVDDTNHTARCSHCGDEVNASIQWKNESITWINITPHICKNMEEVQRWEIPENFDQVKITKVTANIEDEILKPGDQILVYIRRMIDE